MYANPGVSGESSPLIAEGIEIKASFLKKKWNKEHHICILF